MITSIQNSKIKVVRDLLTSNKSRSERNKFVIEGVRLAEEVLEADIKPNLVLFSQQVSQRGSTVLEILKTRQIDIEEVHPDLLDRISDTCNSQGLLMVLPIIQKPLKTNLNKVLVMDNIRDPGNVGTILRSAAALDFEAAILTPGSADPFSPKVLRAGMGAHFKIPIIFMDAGEIADYCVHKNSPALSIFLADPEKGKICWESDLTRPLCLIIGGEAQGSTRELHAIADKYIQIPMLGTSESFNAAVSASILMYEIYRQRSIS